MNRKLTPLNILRLKQTYEKGKRIDEDLRARTRALFPMGHRYTFYIKSEGIRLTGRITGHPKGEPSAVELAVEYLNTQPISNAKVTIHPSKEDVVLLSYGGNPDVYTPYNERLSEEEQDLSKFGILVQREFEFSCTEHP